MNQTLRTRLISTFALTSCLLAFHASLRAQTFTIGPSKGEVVGASVGAGAVITAAIVIPVVIVHHHHNIKGCILTAANGLQLRQGDARTFTLSGATSSVKPGELVSLHGHKSNPRKGSTDTPAFTVDSVTKDYGACKTP